MGRAEQIGSKIISGVRNSVGSFNLLIAVCKKLHTLLHPPVRLVLYKQIYFTGSEAFYKISLMGTLIGIVIIMQMASIVGFQSPMIGRVLVWTIVRELGPIFCAIIIIARSCAAISSELGTMKINKEIDAIKVMGIDPIAYLITPRIVAVTLSMFFLTFYFQFFAVVGGLFLSSLFNDLPLMKHLHEVLSVFRTL